MSGGRNVRERKGRVVEVSDGEKGREGELIDTYR